MNNQPTLFDTSALNLGQEYLAKLDFENARKNLEEALGRQGEKDHSIAQLLDCCDEWHELVADKEIENYHQVLMKCYLSYEFPKNTNTFQKGIVKYIAEGLLSEVISPSADFESFIDDLMVKELYHLATDLLKNLLQQHPKENQYLYFLAQAQFKNGFYDSANENYIRALILHPDMSYTKRIKNKQLKKLMKLYGIYHAPAYSLINNIKSRVHFPDHENLNEHQKEGIKAYRLVQKFIDNRGEIEVRKEISEYSSSLWEECRKLI